MAYVGAIAWPQQAAASWRLANRLARHLLDTRVLATAGRLDWRLLRWLLLGLSIGF